MVFNLYTHYRRILNCRRRSLETHKIQSAQRRPMLRRRLSSWFLPLLFGVLIPSSQALGNGRQRRAAILGFGYAVPDGPTGQSMPPAASDSRVVQARRIGPALPTLPDTPTELAHEVSGSIAAMLKAGPSQRLRIDLQVR